MSELLKARVDLELRQGVLAQGKQKDFKATVQELCKSHPQKTVFLKILHLEGVDCDF